MKSIFISFLTICLLLPIISNAQVGTVKIHNAITKTDKEYQAGIEYFDIDASSISGWNKCIVQPLKVFQYDGQSRMRVDVACSTKTGQLVTFNCSAGKGSYDLSMSQLLATGSKLAQTNQINSNGYMDVTIFCEYIR